MTIKIELKQNKAALVTSKIIIILSIGLLCGYWAWRDDLVEYQNALNLDEDMFIEKKNLDFDSYKEKLIEESQPLDSWEWFVIGPLASTCFFLCYEFLSFILSKPISLLYPKEKRSKKT